MNNLEVTMGLLEEKGVPLTDFITDVDHDTMVRSMVQLYEALRMSLQDVDDIRDLYAALLRERAGVKEETNG